MLVVAFYCAALQDTEVVPRNQREFYGIAILEYEKAWNNLDSDPKQALQAVNRLFQMKMEKKDRRIQLERPNGTLQKPFDFFPNYLRGRIRLALAKGDPDNAQAYLAAAVGDFKASSDAGVKPSEDLLKSTRAWLDRLKAPKPAENPQKMTVAEEAFREAWFKQIEAHKFKAARDLVDQKGASLVADRKREYVRDTEEECRKYVAAELAGFAKAMEVNVRPPQLRGIRNAEWTRIFELPSEADLVGSFPELDWARKEKPTLELVRASTPRARGEEYPAVLDRLLGQLAAAEPLDRTGENKWFRISGQVAFRYLEEVLMSLALQSKDATSEQRHRLHEEAEKARGKWTEMLAKYPKEFLTRNQVYDNARRFSALLEEFPVEVDELDKLSLEACFQGGESPDAALEHMISDLSKIREEHGAHLPKESLRKLLTELVAATAARELLAGKNSEDVGKGLGELGRSLTQAGGPLDPQSFGPKIEKILAAFR